MFGSAFMLVGLIATVALASRDLGYTTFDLVEIADGANFAASTGRWLFFAFAIAFAVKVPIFPFHTWLPDAHTQAPTAGSVVLAGVMLKLGTYGFLRFGLYLFPEAAYWSRPLWLTLAVIGILYGAVVATMQMDLKRLVAYSSVAHMGFIVLGTFAFTTQSLSGGVIQMINHGVSTGALFLLVGMIYERRSTRKISELKGIQQVAPIFAAGFMLVMLSSIGVPGLNGFVGEFLILIGSFLTARWWTVVAAVGVIFAALYLLWAYQRVFHGEPDEDEQEVPGDLAQGRRRAAAVPRGDRVHGRLSEAGARPHRAEHRQADQPRRGPHRLRRARTDGARSASCPRRPPRASMAGGGRVMLAQLETFVGPEVGWFALSPMLTLLAGALGIMLIGALTPKWPNGWYALFSAITAGTAGAFAMVQWDDITDNGPTTLVGGAIAFDTLAMFLTITICIALLLVSLLTDAHLRGTPNDGPELYALYMVAAIGGIVMASANDLIVLFLGLETLSLALVRAGGQQPPQLAERRGRPQVLRARRLLVGVLPLRHRAGLRRHRLDEHLRDGRSDADHGRDRQPEHRWRSPVSRC